MNSPAQLFVDETAPGYFDDPYPSYAPIRTGNPVHQDPRGPWMVFGYDDVKRVLRGPGISSRLAHAPDSVRTKRLVEAWGPGIVTKPHLSRADPPEHTRLRRVLAAAFTPRHMEALRPRIRAIVDELLADAGDGDVIEVGTRLARPLPYRVMCELLGYPPGTDDSLMIECTHAFVVATMEPFMDGSQVDAVVRANQLLTEQIREAVEWKRDHLGDDLMSLLLHAGDEREVLSEDEVVEQVRLLFAAGHETTVNGVELAVLSLMRHRDQWDLLVERPNLVDNAVEELLRYDNTIQIAWRTTPGDLELPSGATVPGGTDVIGWIGSANRDPARFGPTADRLDVTRADAGDHLSFGSGLHLCLGAWLARAEMQELLRVLATRYPAMELAGDIHWEPLVSVRGPERLDLRLRG